MTELYIVKYKQITSIVAVLIILITLIYFEIVYIYIYLNRHKWHTVNDGPKSIVITMWVMWNVALSIFFPRFAPTKATNCPSSGDRLELTQLRCVVSKLRDFRTCVSTHSCRPTGTADIKDNDDVRGDVMNADAPRAQRDLLRHRCVTTSASGRWITNDGKKKERSLLPAVLSAQVQYRTCLAAIFMTVYVCTTEIFRDDRMSRASYFP